jgi:hypothetical protein
MSALCLARPAPLKMPMEPAWFRQKEAVITILYPEEEDKIIGENL